MSRWSWTLYQKEIPAGPFGIDVAGGDNMTFDSRCQSSIEFYGHSYPGFVCCLKLPSARIRNGPLQCATLWSPRKEIWTVKTIRVSIMPTCVTDDVHIRTFSTLILHKWIKWQGTDDLMLSARVKDFDNEHFAAFQQLCRRLKNPRGPIAPPDFYDPPSYLYSRNAAVPNEKDKAP